MIILKENLDNNDCTDINNLKDICIENDKAYLKLETDYKYSNSNGNSENLNNINEFMFYDGNKLIGYAGICDFGGEALEVNGMVHPDYRRKGIFTRLFSLVKDEFFKRESNKMLLLSDNNSIAGIEFTKKAGCDYDHSEYDMNLDMDITHEGKFDFLTFRKAEKDDLEKMAQVNFEFFNVFDFEEFADEKEDSCSSSYTYLLEKDNVVIGKSRLEINDNMGGIYGVEVLPEYRGKGFGKKLLIFSINKLKESNVNAINLQVETNNRNALNLYLSCGFKENYVMDYYSMSKSEVRN